MTLISALFWAWLACATIVLAWMTWSWFRHDPRTCSECVRRSEYRHTAEPAARERHPSSKYLTRCGNPDCYCQDLHR